MVPGSDAPSQFQNNESDDTRRPHEPVLVAEVLRELAPVIEREPDGLLVDGTVGAGGHAHALLAAHPGLQLLGIDRDPSALPLARARLAPFEARVELVHGSYAELTDRLEGRAPIAILLDVGVSSMQIDRRERGFSYRAGDVPPDMRFDMGEDIPSALDLVNHADARRLQEILFEFGDEPRARAVARAIVAARPIRSTEQLAEVIRRHALRGRRHDPATRAFQGLRIAVNDEFGHLERGLRAAIECLAGGGRLAVIAFHSGEERRVKEAFREARRAGQGEIVTRKPIRCEESEGRRNPRARPARLRVFERANVVERD